MNRTKLVYIVSGVNRSLAFEWIASNLKRDQYALTFILIGKEGSVLETFLDGLGVPNYTVGGLRKKEWPIALALLVRLLVRIKPDVVHCHLLEAGILGLTSARIAGVRNRIYTRHHSSLHHVYHPKGVWWDRLCNKWATRVVAVSPVVKSILTSWEGVPQHKVTLIPHGFDFTVFEQVSPVAVAAYRQQLHLPDGVPVIGVVSRITAWKGVHYIIEAFMQTRRQHPDAVLLLYNAQGDALPAIKKQLAKLPNDAYRLIPFEPNMPVAYRLMDVLVHVPVDEHSEAFGQVYVEALASGIPLICTLSGIAAGYVQHDVHARVVPFCDAAAITSELDFLLANKAYASRLALQGKEMVYRHFSLAPMMAQLEELYAC